MEMAKDFLESLSRNPLFIGVTAVLGVVVGVIGSLFTNEIKNTLFNPWWGKGTISWEATWFWILLLVFLGLFISTQWAQNRITDRAQKKLIKKSDQLERLVRTMPPEDFLIQFDEFCKTSYKALLIALSQEPTPEGAEKAIRVVLECIVSLAYIFDGQTKNAKYSANIMLFIKSSTMDNDKREEIKTRLHFADGIDITTLDGVLDLIMPLSTTNGGGPDAELAPFALPVPQNPDHEVDGEKKYTVLPGAPWAFAYRDAAGFPDLAEFEQWAKNQGDFSPGTISDMRGYFQTGKGRTINSFFSVALLQGDADEPVGVLNIHRDVKGMLGERAIELFLPFTSPFRLLLAELIMLREDRKGS